MEPRTSRLRAGVSTHMPVIWSIFTISFNQTSFQKKQFKNFPNELIAPNIIEHWCQYWLSRTRVGMARLLVNQLSLGDKALRFEPRPATPTSNVFWCIQTEWFLELLSRRHERECLSGKKTFNFSTPRTLRKCFRQERNSVKSDERRRFDKKLWA